MKSLSLLAGRTVTVGKVPLLLKHKNGLAGLKAFVIHHYRQSFESTYHSMMKIKKMALDSQSVIA